MVRAAVHADGYGVVLLPRGFAVRTGGGAGGGQPVHAGGERHGVRAGGQRGTVIGHVAARGGKQAKDARHCQMSEWI